MIQSTYKNYFTQKEKLERFLEELSILSNDFGFAIDSGCHDSSPFIYDIHNSNIIANGLNYNEENKRYTLDEEEK
jgi:hypothetical protein